MSVNQFPAEQEEDLLEEELLLKQIALEEEFPPDEEEWEEEEELEPLDEQITSDEKVRLMALAADSLRATEIVALDLQELTTIADYFLICTGNSSIQIRSIADRIQDRMRDKGYRKLRAEGYQDATWILLDYGDVVAHVMAAEQRAFYNLEGFWSRAGRLELELLPD